MGLGFRLTLGVLHMGVAFISKKNMLLTNTDSIMPPTRTLREILFVDPESLAIQLCKEARAEDYRQASSRIIWKLSEVKKENIYRSGALCRCKMRPHHLLVCFTENRAWAMCPISIVLQLTRIHFNGGPEPHLKLEDLINLSTGAVNEM